MPDGGIIDLYEKGCSVRLYLRLFVVGLVSYLGYLSLFAYSGVQCSCFVCLRLVYPVLLVSFLSIVQFLLPLRYSLTFIVP
jgi:hypothetical protein